MRAIDKLIKNLLKYANRPEWQSLLDTVYSEHMEEAAEQLGLHYEEFVEQVQERGLDASLFGVIFEDFIKSGDSAGYIPGGAGRYRA